MEHSLLRPTQWSERLAFDVALTLEGSGETMTEIAARHTISGDDVLRFSKDPVFLKRVAAYREDIRENGLTFKLKARAQAEELLTTSWLMIHDPGVSPAVRADLLKSTVKWAGLEPKDNPLSEAAGGGVRITINLGNKPEDARIINVSPDEEPTGTHDTPTDDRLALQHEI